MKLTRAALLFLAAGGGPGALACATPTAVEEQGTAVIQGVLVAGAAADTIRISTFAGASLTVVETIILAGDGDPPTVFTPTSPGVYVGHPALRPGHLYTLTGVSAGMVRFHGSTTVPEPPVRLLPVSHGIIPPPPEGEYLRVPFSWHANGASLFLVERQPTGINSLQLVKGDSGFLPIYDIPTATLHFRVLALDANASRWYSGEFAVSTMTGIAGYVGSASVDSFTITVAQ